MKHPRRLTFAKTLDDRSSGFPHIFGSIDLYDYQPRVAERQFPISRLYLFAMDQAKADIVPSKLITALRGFNLLPAIVFLPTRRRCDEAASEVAQDKSQKVEPERQAMRQKIFDEFALDFPRSSIINTAKSLFTRALRLITLGIFRRGNC